MVSGTTKPEPETRNFWPEREEDLNEFSPVTTTGIPVDGASALVLVQFCWGVYVTLLCSTWYVNSLASHWAWWFLFPFWLYGTLYLFTFAVIAFTAVWIRVMWKFHPPVEGLFDVDGDEYKRWKRRYWISFFAIWLARALPLPWLDLVCYKMLGVKVGRNCVLYDTWLDTEFVEIGDYVMLSLNDVVLSHCLLPNGKFYVKRVVVKEAGIVGAMSVTAPGTVIEEGTTLGAGCGTSYNQVLSEWSVWVGNPAKYLVPVKRNEAAGGETKRAGEEGAKARGES
ncbi:MAG: hypothetical protein Kow0069_02240 [Promethearchaeota archaeon]